MQALPIVLAVALTGQTDAGAAEPPAEQPRSGCVSETFNDAPFDYRMQFREQRDGYRVYRLSYPSPMVTPLAENNTVPADYYLPDGIEPGDPKRPAVICLHILDGDFELVEMVCSVLAARGIPAIWFKLPYYGERGPPDGPEALVKAPEQFAAAISQALLDVRRTVDLLASRPEVDPAHIGISGISLGAIVASTAAGAEPRIARTVLVMAGGDLPAIIDHARETASLRQMLRQLPPEQRREVQAKILAVDPLRHAAALKARAQDGKVLMINARNDEVIPRRCTEKLAEALGLTDRVIWMEGLGHYTMMAELPRALTLAADFFAEDLPPGTTLPRPARVLSAQQVLARLLSQAGRLLGHDPQPGRGHFAELELEATGKDGRPLAGRLRLVRGPRFKFRIELSVPGLGEVALGQGEYPWMASAGKAVFVGSADPFAEPVDPFRYADAKHVLKLRMAAGALAALGMAPDLLQRWISASAETTDQGQRAICIERKEEPRDRVRVELADDGRTPREITFDVDGVRGAVKVHGWQTNTVVHEALFVPPGELPRQEVDPAELHRMFSALFNFAAEYVQ